MVEIKTILICGAGTMGRGIAQVCAQAGYNVFIYDTNPEFIYQALELIKKDTQTLVEKDKIQKNQQEQILSKIQGTETVSVSADLVIEAIVENIETKRNVLIAIEQALPQSTIITTNTSSIPITTLASCLTYPQRFAGLHFFNPAPVMKLVEIISGIATDHVVLKTLQTFTQSINKISVMANDSPGFIVNRVARHYYVEALKLLEEGVATHDQIDALMRASGFKMGPFELMDLIGVDVNFSVTTCLYNGFHQEPRFRPSRIQQQKVDAGHHGRKTGKGFYDYPASG